MGDDFKISLDSEKSKEKLKLRNLSITICGSLLFIFILNFYFNFFRFPFLNVQLFEAVPANSAIIIECNNIESLNKLGLNSPVWSSIQKTSLFKKIQSDLFEAKSHLLKGEDSIGFFQNNPFIATLQMSSAKDADFLYIINSERAHYKVESLLEKLETGKINKSIFLKEDVYELVFADNQRFTICFYKNILLLARFPFMVEDAIAQLKKTRKESVDNNEIQLVKKSSSRNPEISVYFNLKRIPHLLDRSGQKSNLDLMKNLGSWAAINFRVKDFEVLMDGTFVSDSDTAYDSGTTQPSESKMNEVIPDNCSLLLWQSEKYEKTQTTFEEKDSVFVKFFKPWVGEEYAVFLTESQKSMLNDELNFVYKANDIELAKQLLTVYGESMGELQNIDYQTFIIKQLFSNKLLKTGPFSEQNGLHSPFYTTINDYVIFSNSRQSLEVLIDKHILSQTLSNYASYLQFQEKLAPASNTFFYCNTSLFIPFLRHFSSEMGYKDADAFFDILYNFKTLGGQLERSNKVSHFDFYVSNSESENASTKLIWTANLATNAIIPPAVVKNSQNQQNEIFVQDADNKIYLFDRNGKLIWERFLKAEILSEIFQIEYYNDGENQLLFNTKDHIFLVGHDGKDVGNYPLKLPHSASNGLCLIDFENDKNYKLFIGTQNGSAYAFEKTGTPLEGWNPKENIGKLTHDIQHFQVANNDYILALNDKGDFHVFKRNGEKRFETTSFDSEYLSPPEFQTFDKSARIVLANQIGKAQVFNLKGKHFNLHIGSGNDKNVQFVFADVIGDDRKDYLTLNGRDLTCYYYEKSDFKKAFTKQFEHAQDQLFAIRFDDNKKWKIGTLNSKNKRINLLNNDGSLENGFPLSGTTKFSVVDLFDSDTKVLVTALENSIYACKVD